MANRRKTWVDRKRLKLLEKVAAMPGFSVNYTKDLKDVILYQGRIIIGSHDLIWEWVFDMETPVKAYVQRVIEAAKFT